MPKHLRIFLASPGDVADERALALQVLDRLQYEPGLRGQVTLEAVAWDKPGGGTPMLATLTPQEAIASGLPKPSECDIVVVLLWSRMGTPLPPEWTKSDGSRYLSGTEWEYENAREAAQPHGKPDILLYRRTEVPTVSLSDPQKKDKEEQWQRVEAFFAAFENPDGSIRGGVNAYQTPTDFERALEMHLRDRIWHLLKSSESVPAAMPAASNPAPPLWQGSPFPGLRPFTEQDAPIFFGRGHETDALLYTLADPANRFVAVVGASGSGKSSLVWAGLIPRLQKGAVTGSQDWACARFTPGESRGDPFMALAVALKPLLDPHGQRFGDLAEKLCKAPAAFAEAIEDTLGGRPDWAELLLFVDQFEELFTRVDPQFRKAFIELLASAARTARVRTVVTLRADFYHHCVDWEPLAELLRAGTFPLAAPGVGALNEMITRPAERAGLTFDENLAQRILDDTGREPGALALLAFALSELYAARSDDGRLTNNAYEGFDGVHGAIGKRADDTFAGLKPEVQAKLGDVFRELVEVDQRGVPTRRRAPLDQIAVSVEAKALIDALTDARLLVTGHGEGKEPHVEVAHEALFRSWPRLATWIQETADDHRLRRQVSQLAAYWKAHECKDEHRWPDDRLLEAVAMLDHLGLQAEDLPEPEQAFLGPLTREGMLQSLDDPATDHQQRAIIGVRLSLLGDPRPGVGVRGDGLPDIVWCKVPGGEVTLEDDAGTFTVAPFHIAKYPITWVQYRAFLDAADGFREADWWRELSFERPDRPGRQFNCRDNHPAEDVAWDEAVAFCHWLKQRLANDIEQRFGNGHVIRLPTEWEWQQAATGGNAANAYPWGAEWHASLANTYDSDLSRTTAVGMYPNGASPVGARDMAGNLWEWCLNEYDDPGRTDLSGEANRVVRGGSWYYDPAVARAAYRHWFDPYSRYYAVGLRVVCASPIS